MNTITVRILMFVLSLFVLLTVANQLLRLLNEDYVTETAMLHSSAEKITFDGVYIRQETIVYYEDEAGNPTNYRGVLSYPIPDGGKVARGSVVAYLYDNIESIRIKRQIEELEREVELLEGAQNPGTTDVVQARFISSLIEEEYRTIMALIAADDFGTLRNERRNFQQLLGIYQIVIGEESNYNLAIYDLNAKIAELNIKKSEPIDTVYADISGYFVSHTDGYESILAPDNISEIDKDLINKIVNEHNKTDYQNKDDKMTIGKIIDGYEWQLAGIVDDYHNLKVGTAVSVKFLSTPDIVRARITDIIPIKDTNQSIIILTCDQLNYNFVQRRSERIDIILNDYQGIRVPREAIRFNQNNEIGVYIILGERIAFRKIDVIFESDAYVLSAVTSDRSYLGVYDDIIISGDISAIREQTTIAEDNEDGDEEDAIPDFTSQLTIDN